MKGVVSADNQRLEVKAQTYRSLEALSVRIRWIGPEEMRPQLAVKLRSGGSEGVLAELASPRLPDLRFRPSRRWQDTESSAQVSSA
jgi:hypothetical protein